jgi:hypothetical protein
MNRPSFFRPWPGSVLALVAAGISVAACRGVDPPLQTCSYGGKQVLAGSSFPSTDGCNTCMCGPDAQVFCTEKACLDAAPSGPPADARPADTAMPGQPADAAARPDAVGAPPPRDTAVPGPEGGQSGTCVYGGKVYQTGQSFPADDGCNTCTCLSNGGAGCTRKACPPLDAAAACDLDMRFEYGEVGGLRISVERSVLEPGNKYTRTRTPVVGGGGPVLSCAPPLPGCGTAGAITAAELNAGFMHPDVQAALAEATPPVFGRDLRPVDGTVLEVKRADGRGFLVGQACNAPIGCRNLPAGIAELSRRLRDLDRQQLAAPECDALRSR